MLLRFTNRLRLVQPQTKHTPALVLASGREWLSNRSCSCVSNAGQHQLIGPGGLFVPRQETRETVECFVERQKLTSYVQGPGWPPPSAATSFGVHLYSSHSRGEHQDLVALLRRKSTAQHPHFFCERREQFLDHSDLPWKEAALLRATAELQGHGYHGFQSSAVVWEEVGISQAVWGERVCELASLGLPQQMADSMRETVKSVASREKRMLSSRWDVLGFDKRRTTYYLRFQTFPSGANRSTSDIIVGLNQIIALRTTESCNPSGAKRSPWPQSEQAFRTYVELDSDIRFRHEVRRLHRG